MKQKVCHITTVHQAKDTRVYHKECRGLAEAGYEVKLLVMNAGEVKSDYPGVEIINVERPFKSKWLRLIQGPRAILKKAREVDARVYHFHDPELLLIARALKRTGAAVIYDAHEDVPKQILTKDWIPPIVRKLVSHITRVFENTVVKRLDAVVTVVEGIERRMARQGVPCILIKNYPDLSELPPVVDWALKEQAACYIGDLTGIRGVKELVDAMAFTNAKLYLAGKWSQPGLAESVANSPGWDKTEFLGFLSRSEVSEVFGKTKVGAILFHPAPNHMDALPNKLFEYLSAGIPVVASNFGLLGQIVEEFRCGYTVDPLDPEAIGKAIQTLLDNDEEARSMGEIGRKAVLETFNWETEKEKLLELYEKLLH